MNGTSSGRWKTTEVPPVVPPVPTDRALDLVLEEMMRKGLEVVDMRKVGGAVWMLPGPDVEFFLSRLLIQGLKPRWVEGGGTAIGNRPAYYVKVN